MVLVAASIPVISAPVSQGASCATSCFDVDGETETKEEEEEEEIIEAMEEYAEEEEEGAEEGPRDVEVELMEDAGRKLRRM